MSEKQIINFTYALPDPYLPAGPHMDILSIIPFVIPPQNHVVVPTGLIPQLPDNCQLIISSKRSLAEEHQVVVMNAPAIIHPKSTAPIKIILENKSVVPFTVQEGTAIAQMTLINIVPFTPMFLHSDTENQ